MLEQPRSPGEIPSSGGGAHPGCLPPFPATSPIQMASTKAGDHIQYSLKTARANDGRELSLPKANEKPGGKKKSSRPIHAQVGLVLPNNLSAMRNYFQTTPRMQ